MIAVKIDKNQAIFDLEENITKEIEDILEAEISATIEDIANDADINLQINGAIDFGFLKGSISGRSSGLSGSVSVGVNYAPYIEFGTGGLVDVPQGLESYASQFKGKDLRQINLPARPFLFPAFNKNIELLRERISNSIDEINKDK